MAARIRTMALDVQGGSGLVQRGGDNSSDGATGSIVRAQLHIPRCRNTTSPRRPSGVRDSPSAARRRAS